MVMRCFFRNQEYNSETYGTCKQAFHITGSTDVHIILHMFEFPYAGSLIVPFQTVGGSFNFYCFLLHLPPDQLV